MIPRQACQYCMESKCVHAGVYTAEVGVGLHLSRGVANIWKGEEDGVQGSSSPALGALWAEASHRILGEGQILNT